METFQGFSQNTITFYRNLSQNNTVQWFEAHKAEYKSAVLVPAQQFVSALGDYLRAFVPDIVADPRTNGSGAIFRIYRDVRFSPDKTPYKTFLGIYLWEGPRKKTENSGFYVQLDADKLYLGVGMYIFTKPLLQRYRDAVVHPEQGRALAEAINTVTTSGKYQLGGQHYKKIPRGYDAVYPNAPLLLYNGLYAFAEYALPEELYSRALREYCGERFRAMVPIHRWLMTL